MREHILVIKLSALGDFFTALGPMQAIRRHHEGARITLLTTKPFVALAEACGYFNDIIIDSKPKWHNFSAWKALRTTLNQGDFARVYDLQNNDRTAIYLKLFSPKPEWVGIAKGASHRNTSDTRKQGRAYEGHVETLARAGITDVAPDTLTWLQSNISRFDVRTPYVLLIPGSSPQHPGKRWPSSYYRSVAEKLIEEGIQPVVIGAQAEAETNAEITRNLAALDLTGKTDLADIATLARGAMGALGNDTGPSHIAALTGCPTLVLYCSQFSTIQRNGPLGERAQGFEAENLAALSVDTVMGLFKGLLKSRL